MHDNDNIILIFLRNRYKKKLELILILWKLTRVFTVFKRISTRLFTIVRKRRRWQGHEITENLVNRSD